MGSLNTALMQHGYAILAVIVFLEAIGVPVPAAVALLIAGGAMARGVLQAQYVLPHCGTRDARGRHPDVHPGPLHRVVVVRAAVPNFTESRSLYFAIRRLFLSPRPLAPGDRQIHSRHQHHGAAAGG